MTIAEVATRMLESSPRDVDVDRELLVGCIDACFDCGEACTQCADDCLAEEGRVEELVRCIRLDLDCADVCLTTGRVLSRQTAYDARLRRALLEACAVACAGCGDECERHGEHGMEHCRVCAEQCRRCEQACRDLLAAMA